MYYTTALALIGATLSTFTVAIAHTHNHGLLHKYHARDAEAVAGSVVDLEERQVVTIYTTITQGGGAQAAPTYGANFQQKQQQQQPSSSSTTSTPAVVAAAAAVSAQGFSGNPNGYQQPTTTSSSTTSAHGSSQTGGSKGGSSGTFQRDSSGRPMLTIQNNCDSSIWVGVGNADMVELPKGHMNQSVMDGADVAFKMGWTKGCAWDADYSAQHGNAEVEFTIQPDGKSMTYDLSMEKGKPFMKNGQSLLLEDSSCTQITCPPGQSDCDNAYNSQAQDSQNGQPSLPCGAVPLYFEACTNGGGQSG